jgi:Tfp pilus assembly protein PilX
MKRSNQKGAALIFTMIFVTVLSILAVSMIFLSQSETCPATARKPDYTPPPTI